MQSQRKLFRNSLRFDGLLLISLALTHCAPSREQVSPGAQAGSPAGNTKTPAIVLGPKDLLHVAPVIMPGPATGVHPAQAVRLPDSAKLVDSAPLSDSAATRVAATDSTIRLVTADSTHRASPDTLAKVDSSTEVVKFDSAFAATQAVLAAYGWDTKRFASQLHAETILRMRRQGIGTTGDSAAATAHLVMRITECERDGGVRFSTEAILTKPQGERKLRLVSDTSMAGSEEADPTLVRMQHFAKKLADEIVIKPPAPPVKAKRKKQEESAVPMNFLLF
jgi:hypothetical protein